MTVARGMCCGSLERAQRVNKQWISLVWVALIMASCSQNFSNEEASSAITERGFKPMAKAKVGKSPDLGRQVLGPLSAVAPQGWEAQTPASSMRIVQYGLPGPEGDATLAVFYFGPGQGGGIEANIERWYGQFTQEDGRPTREKARRWERQVGGIAVTLVDISGTYSGGMGSAEEMKAYRMLGAIAAHPSGAVFIKLTGPMDTVEHWRDSFTLYLDSLRAEGDQI